LKGKGSNPYPSGKKLRGSKRGLGLGDKRGEKKNSVPVDRGRDVKTERKCKKGSSQQEGRGARPEV